MYEHQRGGGQAGARGGGRVRGEEPGQAALRGRRARADQPHRLHFAGRQRPGLPQRHLRPAGDRLHRVHRRACSTAAPTSCWSKRSSTRSTPRPRCSPSRSISTTTGSQLPVMISGTITDASGRTLSGQTAEAFWNSHAPRRAALHRLQLRARRGRAAPVRGRAVQQGRHAMSAPTPTPACPTPCPKRLRRNAGADGGAHPRAGREDGLLNIVGGCCGTSPAAHQGRSPRPWQACRRARFRAIAKALPPVRPGAAQHRQGLAVRQRRRAHQRHRLGQVHAPDPRRRLRQGAGNRRQQVENGAQIIDINMDEAMLDGRGRDGDASST